MVHLLLRKNQKILVMELLEQGEQYGLELVRASNGKISRGSVYVLLSRLEDDGLVRSRKEASAEHPGLPRPRYRLTETGKRLLAAWRLANNQGERK